MRRALFVLFCLFLWSSSLGQSTRSTPNEPEGIEALVAEVRQLRKDFADYQWIRAQSRDSPPSFAGSGSSGCACCAAPQ